MNKVENWERKFFDYSERQRDVPMEWGKSDCLLLSLGAIKVITNKHIEEILPNKKFTGKYKSYQGAYRLLKKYTGGGLGVGCEYIAGKMGMKEVPPAFSGRGDLALLSLDTLIGGIKEIVGVVLGNNVAVQGKDGIVFVPRKEIKRAWKI